MFSIEKLLFLYFSIILSTISSLIKFLFLYLLLMKVVFSLNDKGYKESGLNQQQMLCIHWVIFWWTSNLIYFLITLILN